MKYRIYLLEAKTINSLTMQEMKTFLVIATLFIAQAALVKCGDNNDGYDCSYMWMMMNSGPQVTGLSPWLLLCLGIAAVLLSTDITSLSRRINSKYTVT